jgi:hypothetical protein
MGGAGRSRKCLRTTFFRRARGLRGTATVARICGRRADDLFRRGFIGEGGGTDGEESGATLESAAVTFDVVSTTP